MLVPYGHKGNAPIGTGVRYAYTNNHLIDTVDLPNDTTCRCGYDNANHPTSLAHEYTDTSATYYPDGSREFQRHLDYDDLDRHIRKAGDSFGTTDDGSGAVIDSCWNLAFLNSAAGFH